MARTLPEPVVLAGRGVGYSRGFRLARIDPFVAGDLTVATFPGGSVGQKEAVAALISAARAEPTGDEPGVLFVLYRVIESIEASSPPLEEDRAVV